jgi:hypothetical protein
MSDNAFIFAIKFFELISTLFEFQLQARIKACTDAGLIAKNILDQCPAKIEPVLQD